MTASARNPGHFAPLRATDDAQVTASARNPGRFAPLRGTDDAQVTAATAPPPYGASGSSSHSSRIGCPSGAVGTNSGSRSAA